MNRAQGPAATWLLALALWAASLGCARLPEAGYPGAPPSAKADLQLTRRLAEAGIVLEHRAALESAATGHALIPGNKVTLLFDGPQTMGAMSAAIEAARDSINLETYIFDQDELGQRFADLLIRKQQEGVQVNILYDCFGTLGTPEAFFTRMREAGIQLCPFNPLNPLKPMTLNHRDHRKILVVDGTIGFTGGANISGSYAHGSLFHRKAKSHTLFGWRDTHLELEGPAVAALQLLFVENWFSQRADGLKPEGYFPAAAEAGDKTVQVLGSQPGSDFEIYRAYLQAIGQSVRSVHLTAAYFVPDPRIVRALEDAARRGVQVQIVLTSLAESGLVQRASQSYYQGLLQAGVQLFQLKRTILHAKTAVIDGTWSTVGSTNLDLRSFLFNKEVNVIVLGGPFGRQMEDAFSEDLKNSTEVVRQDWDRRPRTDRMKEWGARILEPWL